MQCNHHAEFLMLNLVVREVAGRLSKVNFGSRRNKSSACGVAALSSN